MLSGIGLKPRRGKGFEVRTEQCSGGAIGFVSLRDAGIVPSMAEPTSTRPRQLSAATLAGCLSALIAFELGLRPIAGRIDFPEGTTRAYVAAPADHPVAEMRQYREGLSVAHFDADGARLTGNAHKERSPVGIILGDSHVRALPVDDTEIAASVVERLAWESGVPVHVRQYGFSGAAGPTYAAIAPRLIRDWDPDWVVVVLDQGDLVDAPLVSASNWRMRIGPDLAVDLVAVPPRELSASRRATESLISHSTLGRVATRRLAEIVRAARTQTAAEDDDLRQAATTELPEGTDLVPLATVRALKAAYGDRLLVVYTPYVPIAGGEAPQPIDLALFDACRAEQVECVSTGEAMRRSRDRDGRLSYGFWNSWPNSGHLNATGHRLVAEAIWAAVSARPRRAGG